MLAVPVGIGMLGSLATRAHTDGWYAEAEKAPWNPPDWVFGPVWTTLYLTMGLAAWLVWRRRGFITSRARRALRWYAVQLALNAVWSPLFFAGYPRWQDAALWGAAAVIVALIGALAVTIWAFWPVSRTAAVLMVPYLGWVVYASTLNIYIAAAQ
ncbi:TspO/MBR family protein [Nesterenkonia sp.]|uniref:TspO/MBR family protein n=1 Tax=Nesterenkonia sp. TaxID=704201 RepID=UPI002617CF17|nr:TspO/MBR family protein [Nesterenkonia sp.]